MLRWAVIPTIIGMALGLLAIFAVLGCVLHLSDEAQRMAPAVDAIQGTTSKESS